MKKKLSYNGFLKPERMAKIMKAKYTMAALAAAMTVIMAGCGSSGSVVEVTPTPAATPTPTAVPATVTPVPTSTPAPKLIGVKTSQAKYVYLTNKLSDDIREIYLMTSGGDDWGKNLIPAESSVKAAEQVQMFYTPADSVSSESTDESADTASKAVYDMKIVTAKGDAYQIYSIDLSDMEKASLSYDEETGVAYLSYTSLADKSEKNTKDNAQQTASSESTDESDAAAYSADDSGSSDGSDYSSDDSSSYDSSYDSGSADDSSYDDGSYDSGSYDDGSYDDGSYDDGSYDDGSYDYADEGDDSDSYDSSSDDWNY